MPFIGKQSTSNSQITNYTTTVGSGGQTNFTVVIEGGDETHVYLNGVLLKETTDYTVSSTQVSLVSPAVENDIVEIKVFRSFALVDAVRASEGGTFSGNVSFGDNNKAQFGASNDLQIYHDGNDSVIKDAGTGNLRIEGEDIYLMSTGNEVKLRADSNSFVKLYYDNSEKIATTSAGIEVTGNVVIPDGGNIGSASDTDAISIASNGKPTFSAGIANTGTIDAGTFNGTIGSSASLPKTISSYTWTAWNPSDLSATYTNASSSGITTDSDYTSMSNSSGTLTITFDIAGSYLVNLFYRTGHSNIYTFCNFNTSFGGSATQIGSMGHGPYGPYPANGGSISTTNSFQINASAGQTLTILPTFRLSASQGITSNHTVTANVNVTYCGV